VNLPGNLGARLLMATAVPILLLRGSPAELARSAWGWTPSATALRWWRTLTAPEVALTWFALAVFGWYLPALFSAVMLRPGGYWLTAACALGAGVLVFARSVPPAAGPTSAPPGRAGPASAGVVLVMCAAVSLAFSWSRTTVGETYFRQLTVPYFRVIGEEQRFAGTIAWLSGGLPVLVLLVALALTAQGRPRPGSQDHPVTAPVVQRPPNPR
jgi:putative copper resistance protein D